ncbi:MAG: amidohydrolase family protein, partial [Thermoguttaceae bacterium]
QAFIGAGQGAALPNWGLAPHAPYSVRPELLQAACRLSRSHRLPVAFHLAESREEMQLLQTASGPFRQLLHRLDAWDPTAHAPGRRPLDFLQELSAAHRALVIHGNYLNHEEIAFLARRPEQFTVVYCPRTHAWFQHDPYPLQSMLAAGVNVALGTDSRASSPDLSLLEEMRSVAKRHPGVAPARIIEMATLAGAKALGLDDLLGTIQPGKLARLAVLPLPDRDLDDPCRALLQT